MKLLKKYRIAIMATAAIALMIAACEMVIEEINFPEDAKVSSEITFTVKIKMVTETDDNSQLVFALLVPKSWNLKNNASLTLTTEGYAAQGYPEVVNEPLTLIPDSETEKSTAMSYPMAYQSKIGLMGNTGPVEWTVFKSSTVFHINDKVSTEPIYGTVTITLTTGPDAVKFYLGCGFCGTSWGLDTESGEGRYTPNETAKAVSVYDENGDIMLDYTTTPPISVTPSTFRYGDIFSVNFVAEGTPLAVEDAVFLCAKAVLADGREVIMDRKETRSRMVSSGETAWFRYIYPKDFFSLSDSDVISDIYVWFSNSDGSVEYRDGEDGTLLEQAGQ